jgi:hypothetical protein
MLAYLRGNWLLNCPIVLATRQHRPCDPCQLVGCRDDEHVARGSGFKSRHSCPHGNSVSLAANSSLWMVHSSCSKVMGSTDSVRRAGIHVATTPSSDIVTTTPANTNGSRGVA